MHTTRATAFAPATVANVAVGFDILGFPVEGVGDTVSVERLEPGPGAAPTVLIESIDGKAAGCAGLPLEAGRNTAGIALLSLLRDEGLSFGFALRINKGIPLSSGMGGSAASSVAALVAANALLPRPLPPERLLAYALLGEELASGSAHGDNAAPCLYGGLTVVRSLDPIELVRVPLPAGLAVALAHPHMELDTRTSRAALPSELPLKEYVAQSANLASFIASCYTGDLGLMGRSLCDVLVEPRRARLIPAFSAVKRAALKAGALGCSISGSGPSLFALCGNLEDARRSGAAMAAAWEAAGIGVDLWTSIVATAGARIVPEGKEAAP